MDMRTYSVYIIRNTVNEKVYIGQTIQTIEERFKQHLKPSVHKQRGNYKLYNAMRKYGKENFYVELLEENISADEIDAKEIQYIEEYDSFFNGYNSTKGGDGKTISKIDDVELFKELYLKGAEIETLAMIFNVNKVTVRRTACSLGMPKRVFKVTKEYLIKNIRKTNKKMAKELNVDEETITRAIKRYGIRRGKGCNNTKNKQNQPKLSKADKEEFKRMWNDVNVPVTDIAKKLNIHIRTVYEYKERLGLPNRRSIRKIYCEK